MNPQVGENIMFICQYEKTRKGGQVLRIMEEVEDVRPRLFLVRSQGVMGSKQWVRTSKILSIVSEG